MPGSLSSILAAVLCAAPAAQAAAPVKVTSVEARGGKLFIHATAKPEFTVFKLSGPPRVVIDLNGGDVTAAARQVDVHQGGIAGYSGAQFDEGATRVGRIVVALEGDAKYDVSAAGNDLVLTVEPSAPAAASQAAAAAPRASADPNLVTTRDDVVEVKNPAHKLSAVTVTSAEGQAMVRVAADGEIARYTLTELKNPGRLALDLHGVAGRAASAAGAGLVKTVRLARHDDGVRVVVDAQADSMPKYEISRTAHGLDVRAPTPPPPASRCTARRCPTASSAISTPARWAGR